MFAEQFRSTAQVETTKTALLQPDPKPTTVVAAAASFLNAASQQLATRESRSAFLGPTVPPTTPKQAYDIPPSSVPTFIDHHHNLK